MKILLLVETHGRRGCCVVSLSKTLYPLLSTGSRVQGQGIVREFYVVSGKNECFLKCQGNVREFYNFQFVSNDEKQKIVRAAFLTFWIQA